MVKDGLCHPLPPSGSLGCGVLGCMGERASERMGNNRSDARPRNRYLTTGTIWMGLGGGELVVVWFGLAFFVQPASMGNFSLGHICQKMSYGLLF